MKYNPQIHHRRSVRLKGYDYSQAGAYFITICTQDRECMFGKIVVGANPRVRPDTGVRPEMILNDAGIMINKWWQKIPEKFPDIELDVYQIMPNHFHAIVINNGAGNVGANPRVRPDADDRPDDKTRIHPDDKTRIHPDDKTRIHPDDKTRIHPDDKTRIHPDPRDNPKNEMDVNPKNETSDKGQTRGSAPTTATDSTLREHVGLGEHMGSPLHRVVQWFKTMSTNEYIRGVKSLGWKPFNGKLWQRNYHEHIIRNDQSYQNISYYIITNPEKWKEDKFFKD